MTTDNLVLATLVSARALIKKPEQWTQRAWARDAEHRVVGAYVTASCYCAGGALKLAARRILGDSYAAEEALLNCLPSPFTYFNVTRYNDDPLRTHAEVLALFDEAIAKLQTA